MTAILSSFARFAVGMVTPPNTAAQALPAPASRVDSQSYLLFPESEYGAIQQRTIHNPNGSGSIWVAFSPLGNPTANRPKVNGEGSFEIAPGGRWSDAVNNAVYVLFTAPGMSITAYER